MSLQEKVLRLKLEGALAVRHAHWWEKQIQIHGEEKATAFYTSLGLNHLNDSPKSCGSHYQGMYSETCRKCNQKAAVQWEGLTLSREPTEAEKLCVKGIAQAQESSKEKLITLLTQLRLDLISDGLEGIRKLKPSTYHELTLSASTESRESLRDRLIKVYKQGRSLVLQELTGRPKGKHVPGEGELKFRDHGIFIKQDEDEFDDLDELTDLTDARVANDVQSRIISAATRFALLGLVGVQLWAAVSKELADGSVSYIDRAASGVSNRVLSIGRMDEMRSRADEIERYEQSEILDQNTCGPCAEDDGKEADNPDDLPGAPNPSCEGGDYCRGFIVAIAPGG